MVTFDYSIVKYMPDPRRGEIVNIGLIIFKGKGLDVRLLQTQGKVRMLDGHSEQKDIDSLRTAISTITQHVKEPENQLELLKSLNNKVIISNKAYFSIPSTSNYEQKVKELFELLVKPHPMASPTDRQCRIVTTMKKKFKKLDILGKDKEQINEHLVIPNFVLSEDTDLRVDFLLKNGSYHITEAIDFNVHNPKEKYKETTYKVLAFVESKELFDANAKCYFAYSASTEKEEEVTSHLRLAEKHSDFMFNLHSKKESSHYYQLMESLASQGNTIN
jgi:hypothetical protein